MIIDLIKLTSSGVLLGTIVYKNLFPMSLQTQYLFS